MVEVAGHPENQFDVNGSGTVTNGPDGGAGARAGRRSVSSLLDTRQQGIGTPVPSRRAGSGETPD